jgi:c-di-GMP-related signal transduction protein
MEAYVARQPIFERDKRIYGYELLFRDGMSNFFPVIDGDVASSTILSNSFITFGIDHITRGRKAFINFTKELLLRRLPTMFPREKIIVEILENVEPEDELLCACQEIAQDGYDIALDDFFYRSELKPLVALAKIIKFDLRLTPLEEVKELLGKLAPYRVNFLAEKVETHEEFEQTLAAGFQYFQGYFFSKPEILKTRDIPPYKLNLLRITALANRSDFRFNELEGLISRDVSISYKLMRYINSAYFRSLKEISSIRQAIVLLGEKGIRRFISLMSMAKLAEGKPSELIRACIIRARLCELLGKASKYRDESELFTLGLFSLIDAVLDDTMENLMSRLPFSEDIKSALIKKAGEFSNYINLASCYEKGDWEGVSEMVSKIGVNEEKVAEYYMDAVGWADSYQTS